MLITVLALVVSLLTTLGIVHWVSAHPHVLDHDVSGPQKFHARPVPRVGGIGIFVALVVVVAALPFLARDQALLALGVVACGLPAFAVGLIEDLTKRVSPGKRLLATAVSAALAFWLIDGALDRTGIPGLDWLATMLPFSLAFSLLAVAGIANSVNIIDGFNGLASMCVVLMLGAVAYVAYQVGDPAIGMIALAGIGAVLGFFVWNFPAGLIFLGDGGAYFLGYLVAELAILLLARNPEVSGLFPLLVCIYPVFETLFSIYRRRYLRQVPPSMPDGIHLHSLIYRRVIRWAIVDKASVKALTRRNSMTSPYLWLLCMASVIPAVLFWNHSLLLGLCLALFGLTYVSLYWRIVRFNAPRWMHLPSGWQRRSESPHGHLGR